jgi:hypothetical protein
MKMTATVQEMALMMMYWTPEHAAMRRRMNRRRGARDADAPPAAGGIEREWEGERGSERE